MLMSIWRVKTINTHQRVEGMMMTMNCEINTRHFKPIKQMIEICLFVL